MRRFSVLSGGLAHIRREPLTRLGLRGASPKASFFLAKDTASSVLSAPSLTPSEARGLRDRWSNRWAKPCLIAAGAALVVSAVLGALGIADAPRPVVTSTPFGASLALGGASQ